ncbi:hypothetical protein HZA97_06230 [Candidatus Woesearchaeota archaeon]|nr:hypothetical protein [Candidatus Woesearchaeota archaeon]
MNTNISGDKKKSNFDDNLADYVPKKKIIDPGNLCVRDLDGRYVLNGVEYDHEVVSVGWSKELLDGGKSHTQKKWTELVKDTKFRIASADLYFASLLILYKNQNSSQAHLVEKVRQLFAKDFNENWMMTSTRLSYKHQGRDEVIHNYGSLESRALKSNFAGNHCYVDEIGGLGNNMIALLGSNDLNEVSEVFKWITGKRTYLRRLNKPTTGSLERAVVFGGYYFSIIASGSISSGWPARGVVVVRENL